MNTQVKPKRFTIMVLLILAMESMALHIMRPRQVHSVRCLPMTECPEDLCHLASFRSSWDRGIQVPEGLGEFGCRTWVVNLMGLQVNQ